MPEMPEKTQLINVQTRNFNRHIMTAKTQNTYIYLHNYCRKMPENARKTPRKPQENPKKTPRKRQENAKKTPRKPQENPNLFARRNATLIAVVYLIIISFNHSNHNFRTF